jgi:chemotaxis response regulator CheB
VTERVAVVLDDWAIESLPGLDRDLAHAGAMVMRSFQGLPNPVLLRRFGAAAVVGGPDRTTLLARLETAVANGGAPVIAALPKGVAPSPELRGPGVVDLVPAGSRGAAERVLLMARVPVVSGGRLSAGRGPPGPTAAPGAGPPRPALPAGPPVVSGPTARPDPDAEVLAVASSTGGVWVLAAMLRDLDRGRVVAVAQHLDRDFVPFFAEWLQGVSGWHTVVVGEPVPYAPGLAYVPAGGWDLLVERGVLRAAPACGHHVPSGDRLLRTAAQAAGRRAVGVVLSGMGSDGAEGLAEISRAGGRTFCQDPASAVVGSMPESALRRAPRSIVAAPEALAAVIGRARPLPGSHVHGFASSPERG